MRHTQSSSMLECTLVPLHNKFQMERCKKSWLITTNPPLTTDPWEVIWKAKQDATLVLGCQLNNLCNIDTILSLNTNKSNSTQEISVSTLLLNVYLAFLSLFLQEKLFFFTLPDIHAFDTSSTRYQNWVPWSPLRFSLLKSRSVSNLAFCSLLFIFSGIYSNYSYFTQFTGVQRTFRKVKMQIKFR